MGDEKPREECRLQGHVQLVYTVHEKVQPRAETEDKDCPEIAK